MKRCILLFVFIVAAGRGAFPQALSAGIGVDFPNYEKSYLDIRAQYIHYLNPDVEINLGGSFAISTHKDNGDTDADFLIPLDIGVNFLFPLNEVFAYYFGLGASTQFLLPEEGTKRAYLGPFAALGLRVGIHPYMEWYLEARQDLLFGEPDWINTSTRLSTGIVFPL